MCAEKLGMVASTWGSPWVASDVFAPNHNTWERKHDNVWADDRPDTTGEVGRRFAHGIVDPGSRTLRYQAPEPEHVGARIGEGLLR